MNQMSVGDRVAEAARKYVLQYAFFRPESAVVIALTIVLAGLAALKIDVIPGQWWMYLSAGLLGEIGLVVTTLRDVRFYQSVMNKLFKEQFDLSAIRSNELRQKLVKAIAYRESIMTETGSDSNAKGDGLLALHVRGAAGGLEDWIRQMYRVALGLDAYMQDTIVARDIDIVPKELASYQAQLARARTQSSNIQPDLEKAVEMKQAQWNSLRQLQEAMSRAQMQLDGTLSAMGTIYSQARTIGASESNNGRAQRLQQDMQEQVQQLSDTQAALEDVYSSGRRTVR